MAWANWLRCGQERLSGRRKRCAPMPIHQQGQNNDDSAVDPDDVFHDPERGRIRVPGSNFCPTWRSCAFLGSSCQEAQQASASRRERGFGVTTENGISPLRAASAAGCCPAPNQHARMQLLANACHMLFEYTDNLKTDFAPYVPRVAEVMVPLIGFPLMAPVRIAAICSIPKLLVACAPDQEKGVAGHPAIAQALLNAALPQLIETLQDMDLEISTMTAECLSDMFASATSPRQPRRRRRWRARRSWPPYGYYE